MGYLLAGNPTATLAWYLDKFHQWSDTENQSFTDAWNDREILDQIALMLLTGTEETAIWIYHGFLGE